MTILIPFPRILLSHHHPLSPLCALRSSLHLLPLSPPGIPSLLLPLSPLGSPHSCFAVPGRLVLPSGPWQVAGDPLKLLLQILVNTPPLRPWTSKPRAGTASLPARLRGATPHIAAIRRKVGCTGRSALVGPGEYV